MAQQTITALYDNYDDASTAVSKLEAAGVSHSDISIVSNNEGDRHAGRLGTTTTDLDPHTHGDTPEKASTGAGAGATVGTVLGGAAGLLTGLGPRSMAPHTWWWHPFRCGSGVTTTSTTAAPTKEVP